MRRLLVLLSALLACPAAAQVDFDPGLREAPPTLDSCGRRVGLIGRPILDFEDTLQRAGHPTRVADTPFQVPALLSWGPDVVIVLRSGADAARTRAAELNSFVQGGGILVTEFTATQVLYEPGFLHYLDGGLVDDFYQPSGSACGGNAIGVEISGHPITRDLPDGWACSGNPMGTFQVFGNVDPDLCVVLSLPGSDRDGDGRDDPVVGVTRVGLGTVVAIYSDFGNFQVVEDPRSCPMGPGSASCRRSIYDDIVLFNIVCNADEPAECVSGCGTCDALLESVASAEIGNEGVRHALEVKALGACDALRRGRLLNAGNRLCALRHQVDAQDGKQLAPDSADAIRTCLHELSEAEGLRPALPLVGCGGRVGPSAPGGGRR